MARRLRYIPPGGALVEITCRTIQGRLLLRPSAGMNDVIRGVLARAARRAGLAVHAPVFLSNHYHLLVSVSDAQQLAEFMNYLHSNLAREAGRLVGWREKFWGRRFQAVLVSDEEEAQVGRLAYVLAQGVKEGRVASPFDWPGVHCAQALTVGSAISGSWRDRTFESRARRKGLALDPQSFVEQETLHPAPLPCWKSLPPEKYRARVRQLIEAIETEARLQQEETGRAPLGSDAVCRQNPHHEPNRMKKGPAPLVHAVSPAVRRSLRKAYFAFREAYRYAANRLRAGATDFEFPRRCLPSAASDSTHRPNGLGASKVRVQLEDAWRTEPSLWLGARASKAIPRQIERPARATALRNPSDGRYDLLDRVGVSEKSRKITAHVRESPLPRT